MKANERLLRESIRLYVQKLRKENKEADAEWMVDKVLTAIDAATNKDKDYQYAAAFDSDKLKKLAQDIQKEKQQEAILKETFLDWLAGGLEKYGRGIIDRRAGYLTQAMKSDPRLAQMAKNAGMNARDFESKMYSIMKSDTKFLKALATQRFRK